MKTNYWLILGTMLATSAVAQVDTNTLPAIPEPATTAATPAVTEPVAPEVAPAAEAPVKKAAPKKKKAVKKINEPSVSLLPGTATVTAKTLNVRGQAGLRGEMVGQLKKGETVTVISQINLDKHALDEPAQWAKIALPSGTKVWVSSHFVDADTKAVTARRLNLRAGPGENFSVIGTIERGTQVSEITSKGNWMEIAPPADAFAFVAAMYLEQTPGQVEQAQPAPVVETTPAPTPVPTTTTTVAETQPVVPPTMGGMTPGAGANPMPVAPIEPEIVVDTNPPPPRVATHEGIVRSSVSPIAPTPYELYDPASGNAINYLNSTSTNLDLSRYDGAQIMVTGEEGMAARWKDTPVLTIQRIYVVDPHPPIAYERLQSPRASKQAISGNKPLKRH